MRLSAYPFSQGRPRVRRKSQRHVHIERGKWLLKDTERLDQNDESQECCGECLFERQ